MTLATGLKDDVRLFYERSEDMLTVCDWGVEIRLNPVVKTKKIGFEQSAKIRLTPAI